MANVEWTALVLAGSRPGRDEFAESHGTDLKALIPVGGVAMVARPVGALLAASVISAVRVLAQQPERIAAALPDDPRLSIAVSGRTIASTLEAILADPQTSFPLLVTTADHALLDVEMISDFCQAATG
ncbi:MAG: nucleotidyltransferase family protein, partial [Pseudomonadota bacterium]|nr:nucleotidyltransferase family protein [Pseudomonadota bacterium]